MSLLLQDLIDMHTRINIPQYMPPYFSLQSTQLMKGFDTVTAYPLHPPGHLADLPSSPEDTKTDYVPDRRIINQERDTVRRLLDDEHLTPQEKYRKDSGKS